MRRSTRYSADMGAPDRQCYRRTPPGAPTVADLVRPGDTVATSYNTGGVVISVEEAFYRAPRGEMLSHLGVRQRRLQSGAPSS
jgi:hypothetical protein